MIRLLREFRNDPALAVITLLLAGLVLSPLWSTPILPLNDLHDHVGAAAILVKALFGVGTPGTYYRVQLTPLPYWTAYFVLVVANAIGGGFFAAKAVVGLILLLVPLGVMRLLVALGRSPRLGVGAFLLAWDQNLYWGWISYALGVALVFFTLATMIEMQTRRDLAVATALATLTALTHIMPFGMLLLCGAWIVVFVPSRSRGRWNADGRIARAVPLLASFVVLLPWFARHLRPGSNVPNSATVPLSVAWFGFEWHSLAQKIGSVFVFTLDNIPDANARQITASVFVVVILLPVIAGAMAQRKSLVAARRLSIAFYLSLVGLYLVCPMQMKRPIEHWYTYPRFATPALLFAFALPAPRLQGRTFAALSVITVCALVGFVHETRVQFRKFATIVEPFLDVVKNVRPGSTYLPLVFEDSTPYTRLAPLQQLHAYVLAETEGFDPYIYDNDNVPVVYRPEARPPAPPWNRARSFDAHVDAKAYDYILVQGAAHDPIHEGWFDEHDGLKRRAAEGNWVLYEHMRR